MKHIHLDKIKSLEQAPKKINIFSTKEIEMIQEFYNILPEITFNKKQNVRKKPWQQNFNKELDKINKAVAFGNRIGLEVHAGHGLTYKSAKILSKTKGIKEFNIGHFLIGESIFVGLPSSIKQFKKIIK